MTLNIRVSPHHFCLSSLKLMHNKRKLSTFREQILSQQKQPLFNVEKPLPESGSDVRGNHVWRSLIAHQGMVAIVFPRHVAGIYIWKLNCLLEGFYSMQVWGELLIPQHISVSEMTLS